MSNSQSSAVFLTNPFIPHLHLLVPFAAPRIQAHPELYPNCWPASLALLPPPHRAPLSSELTGSLFLAFFTSPLPITYICHNKGDPGTNPQSKIPSSFFQSSEFCTSVWFFSLHMTECPGTTRTHHTIPREKTEVGIAPFFLQGGPGDPHTIIMKLPLPQVATGTAFYTFSSC